MKFLLDNMLSPWLAQRLRYIEYDAIHVRDIGMRRADDREVMRVATEQDRVLMTVDRDFAQTLASTGATSPSVVMFKYPVSDRPSLQWHLLERYLPQFERDFIQPALVVVT